MTDITIKPIAETKAITLLVENCPDLVVGHRAIAPREVEITYRWVAPEHSPAGVRQTEVQVTGPRRLKSGDLGQEITRNLWRDDDRPAWLRDLIDRHTPYVGR